MSKTSQKLIAFLLGLAAVGFLAPRFEFVSTRLAVTDLACFLIICVVALGPTNYSHYRSGIRGVELSYTVIFSILGIYYSLVFYDLGSLIIPLRVLYYCLAGASVAFLSKAVLDFTLKAVTFLIILFYIPDAVNAFTSLVGGKITLIEFMWNYEAGRLTAPYEGSEGTSSVPIGYLFSFIFLYTISQYYGTRSVKWFFLSAISITMCVLTASRSSVLTAIATVAIFYYYDAHNSGILKRIIKICIALIVIYFLGEILLSKSVIDGSLDGSSTQRVLYYQTAYNNLFSDLTTFLLGNGISDSLLLTRTGIAFYESLLFNSMAQGGIILFFSSAILLASTLYFSYRPGACISLNQKRQMLSIGLVIIIGNALGGANYFSIYSYLYFRLLYEKISRMHYLE